MADSFNLEAYRLSDERWPGCAQCSHYFQQRMLGNTYRVNSLEPGDSLSAPLPSNFLTIHNDIVVTVGPVGSLQPEAYTSFFGFVFRFYNLSNVTKTVLSPASVKKTVL